MHGHLKMIILSIITYIILISWLAWYVNKPKQPEPDVIKKNGIWYYNKGFKKGDVMSVPIDCLNDVQHQQKNN